MRDRAFRRHQTYRHMWRRLHEDRNQHRTGERYGLCACFFDLKAMACFKEQPQLCSRECCGNQRKHYGRTIQELKNDWQ